MNTASIEPRQFGELPIYDDLDVSEVRRAAVVDVGSNSVRLVVFDGAARSPAYFYNEKVMCGLGSALATTGRLDVKGKQRALETIRRFMHVAGEMEVTAIVGVGTAAMREASDGPEFLQHLREVVGLNLIVASGEQEAILAGQGVVLGFPDADGLVSDLGGASMELARIADRRISNCLTSQLGTLVIRRHARSPDELKRRIDGEMRSLHAKLPITGKDIHLVGGSWRAIAQLDMERRAYPLRVLNAYELTCESALRTIEWVGTAECNAAALQIGLSQERFRLVPMASVVMRSLIEVFSPRRLVVSAHGIREGMLYEQMPRQLQLRDPLIEASKHAERMAARLPGYGGHLYNFILPLFKRQSADQLRLIRAACLLHDVSWRAHPDYRAVVCFDYATRANLCGLDHAGRAFLAVALYHRYQNSGDDHRVRGLQCILGGDRIKLARQVGKAMRFGAMLTVGSPEGLGRMKFKPRKHVLSLHLPRAFEAIWGGTAEERFEAVAREMGCRGKVQLI
ncbi:MAG: Ppx/GppA family phosphatase [Rhodobacteraceae bacterium]|nr:Ppx/GppA family phosphatase [Paracoccaceae bacterium]